MTVQIPVESTTVEATTVKGGGAVHDAAPWSPTVVGEVAEVIANDAVNLEYRHLIVRCSSVAAGALPGQFFQLLCPHTDGAQPFLRRPMSLYGAHPVPPGIEVFYKNARSPNPGLATLRPPYPISIIWRLGAGFTTDPS